MMLTDRFDDALVYAATLHRDQRRKGTDVPYVAHLLGVASIALEMGADEDEAIAALLHDSIEDQDATAEQIAARFGPAVARIVQDCTDSSGSDKAPWRERKEAYLAALPTKPAASLRVSLADKTYNARAIVEDLAVLGEALWPRFTAPREDVLWYYRSLADAFTRALPGPAADRFDALVREMHALADDRGDLARR